MGKIRILAVDDEFGIRSGIKRILSKFEVDYPFMDEAIGFEIIEAETGEAAIELLQNEKFGIVLLDNKLPGIQGVEVLEYISDNNIDTKVVMITSYASLELAVKATSEGAIDFVPKPFTPQELKASIENITKQMFLKKMAANLHREGRQIKFQFLSLLSHELKGPVDEVEECLRKIKDKALGDKVLDYLPMLEKSNEKLKTMRAMINDLMVLTKTKNPLKEKNNKVVDIYEVAVRTMNSILPEATKKSVKLYISGDKGIIFNIDPYDIEIIFNNIIMNFLKNANINSTIECIICIKNNNPTIIVTDLGYPKEENLVKNSNVLGTNVEENNTKIPGSELGLSLVNKILEDYHFKLVTESFETGSKIEVTFNSKLI